MLTTPLSVSASVGDVENSSKLVGEFGKLAFASG